MLTFEEMPGAAFKRRWSGSWFCIAAYALPGWPGMPPQVREVFDWGLDRRAAEGIVAHRDGADVVQRSADDDLFDTLTELDGSATSAPVR